jgi:hypothetical protein
MKAFSFGPVSVFTVAKYAKRFQIRPAASGDCQSEHEQVEDIEDSLDDLGKFYQQHVHSSLPLGHFGVVSDLADGLGQLICYELNRNHLSAGYATFSRNKPDAGAVQAATSRRGSAWPSSN